MGFRDWLKKEKDNAAELRYYFDVGCEVLGTPDGGWWGSTLAQRMERVNAGRRAEGQRRHYAEPSREDGYYSESRRDGAIGQFFGPDGDITSERPHVHVIHNEREGRIIFMVTQRDGSHTDERYLPINASGNEVNAMIYRLCAQLR